MKPGVVYDDYLSGLYNIRSGAYGPMRDGKTYVLNVPKKEGKITLALAQREETRQRLYREGPPGEKTFFCRIFMPKEDLGSGTGRLEGWFSGQGVPLTGVVEDVALLGDVRGTLLRREAPRRL
jgi:hypothetical protein